MDNESQNSNARSEPDIETINAAARSAVARALFMKKRLGLSAVAWKDGRIVVIPPEQIEVDENLLKQNGNTYIVD
jgi:hypothetical protein